MMVPATIVRLLLGMEISGAGIPLSRCFGIALLGLGLACWPVRQRNENHAPFRALLIYNALIALYLSFLGTAAQLQGLLLWPAVVLHAAVAFALVWLRWTMKNGRG
jgi:hypothetical protein